MDVLVLTEEYRKSLLEYIKPYLSEQSYLWVRSLLSDINKKVGTLNNEKMCAHVLVMYRNIKRFFSDYCTDVNSSTILLTLYLCAIELGFRNVRDRIEQTDDFAYDIDMDAFVTTDKDDLINYDLAVVAWLTYNRLSKPDDKYIICAGGINCLHLIDFI